MKETALTQIHVDLGAKMAEFAGYNMPIVYSSINEEHKAVREDVGIFDVSHMGEFRIKGPHALDLLQKVTSNDVSKLENNQAQYSCLPNDKGGIVDDLIVYKIDDEEYFLVVNASNIEKDWNWIASNNEVKAEMINESDTIGLLAVQGPNAEALLQKLTDVDLSEIDFYHFRKGTIAGIENAIISATGYTGSGGFEIYVPDDRLADLWNAIDAKPCGLGARDTLRLEKGYCLYGNDINDETSPLEAGLGWITKLKIKEDFNSKDLFIEQKAQGITKKLVGFKVDDRRVPRHGYKILNEKEEEIGVVTSGTQSPNLSIPIGLGYVPTEYAVPDTSILISTGRKNLKATICKIPFV
ncbi:glycine cleavage system aminomethyltransferase GcvT [Portibacter lacus]|uniref:Aminomethyltransferase n=1 Tax=Portibacter lacus TaxID=1099794 RepID=A0AA37WGM7_9BACT|nr:glycine cleavage system aminomethyltransferase GcvT [Portibacter lacus]GLR18494.1 aminomethyltransferase [Portibacter lacus]